MTSLVLNNRAQLVKCLMTLQPNMIFFVEKIGEAFVCEKLLHTKASHIFSTKILAFFIY